MSFRNVVDSSLNVLGRAVRHVPNNHGIPSVKLLDAGWSACQKAEVDQVRSGLLSQIDEPQSTTPDDFDNLSDAEIPHSIEPAFEGAESSKGSVKRILEAECVILRGRNSRLMALRKCQSGATSSGV